jgi:hypothetical protein
MATIIDDLKAQARILHRRAVAQDAASLARLEAANVRERPIQRRHCLSTVARELGFDGWPHAVAVLRGRRVRDFGTLLYPPDCAAHFNIWCASYDEARSIRAEHGGYLLAYKHQFFIVDSHFVESLGLDARDPDWERIGRDWVEPKDGEARSRLYEKLVRRRQAALRTAT